MSHVAVRQKIPQEPPGYPILGHIPAFLRDRLGFLSSCAAFAKMQGALVLATIAQSFAFHSVPGRKTELEPRMTLRPRNGIRLRAERRPQVKE